MVFPTWKSVFAVGSLFITGTRAADCTTATVGSPYSTCYDIYTAVGITASQLSSYNPSLDCSALQIGQKVCISSGTLPSNSPKPNADGSCATYTTVAGDYCTLIAAKFSITTTQIESWNAGTYKWKGEFKFLQLGFTLCVSSGTPPPIPINPDLQCGPESSGNATCPLKACCSAYGYCGTTADFCNAAPNGDPCISNCFMPTLPSCSSSQVMCTVGYYAGWASSRKCDNVKPLGHRT
ncbi:putative effector protein [Ceratobasidium theobromae]|uniref:Putative effector protein n=1 Tax=Ceratobasidium theobromae TaxID=1582974 RepID=A0A5N5Q880_9AGAM|nr:putative effector protein [Ceratobasidium theobromae]